MAPLAWETQMCSAAETELRSKSKVSFYFLPLVFLRSLLFQAIMMKMVVEKKKVVSGSVKL